MIRITLLTFFFTATLFLGAATYLTAKGHMIVSLDNKLTLTDTSPQNINDLISSLD